MKLFSSTYFQRMYRLVTVSVIRLDKIATISKDLILGEIGEIGVKLNVFYPKRCDLAISMESLNRLMNNF
jgi:hypothetical protein